MFVAIAFGPAADPNQFWNHITYHSNQYLAERWALDQKVIGGIIGYVVIESNKDSWRIVDEMGTDNVSVAQVNSFFKVQPAPRLVTV